MLLKGSQRHCSDCREDKRIANFFASAYHQLAYPPEIGNNHQVPVIFLLSFLIRLNPLIYQEFSNQNDLVE